MLDKRIRGLVRVEMESWVRDQVGGNMLSMYQECLKQSSLILQEHPGMLQDWFNMSQLPSPNEGLVKSANYN